MRGEFENIWQDSFDGASMAPSEEVWNKVAASMDSSSGKRSWVTILLIAATVTMAFAFPLTVGNSEYELKPQVNEITEIDKVKSRDGAEGAQLDQDNLIAKSGNFNTVVSPAGAEQETAINANSNNLVEDQVEENIELVNVKTKGLTEYQELQTEPAMGTDQYYILPMIKMKDRSFDRSLLAYGNFNSGRQTSSAGVSEMNLFSNAADYEAASPGFSRNDYTNGTEEGGSTFYIGGGAELPVSNRINLNAGLGYQVQRLNGTSNMIFEENGQEYPLGIYDPINPGTVFLAESYDYTSVNQFISIPIGAKYALVDKKAKFRVGLALSPDFMISHKVTAFDYGSSSTRVGDTDYNPVQLTGIIGLDVVFPLSMNYGLALETGIRQGLVSYVQNGSDYSTSFNFGVILFYQIK